MNEHLILPPQLAINSMRSSGYRDAAHAIAELVDNSIQAGEDLNECTNVEVLCLDRREIIAEREKPRMHEIAVYDDACGMSASTLRMALQFGAGTRLGAKQGMGKFGMGLPNASISQCKRVDVWSWQNGDCYHSYLDINEIAAGKMVEVPIPKPSEIPAKWREVINAPIKSHGTLVVWQELDKVNWKASSALLKNTELLIGRIYRYFLNQNRAKIRMASYEGEPGSFELTRERNVRPSDPLYLMSGTSAPAPYDEVPAFTQFGDDEVIEVRHQGQVHHVTIRYSIATPEARGIDGGHTALGKHTRKNIGVSVVRADRELAMEQSFNNQYDPRERWWGIEVRFSPALDEVFGVSNDKQAANNFRNIDLEEDAKSENLTNQDYKEMLAEDEDPRLVIYEVAAAIRSTLRTMRDQIERYTKGTRTKRGAQQAVMEGSAEAIGTKITNERRQKIGDTGRSDSQESEPRDVREALLRDELSESLGEEHASKVAHDYVQRNLKFYFDETRIPGSMMFDVSSKAGTIFVKLNSSHPVTQNLVGELQDHEDEMGPALAALKLMIMAWARMEDEANDELRQTLEDIRSDWGKIARDFVKALKE